MSNQILISSGAKVRDLNGVLTGTTGVVSSVPLGAANGVATLDAGGKVPVSQLPSSVVTYLGTWNAATNTPTLVNGTGDAGDMYICNVAGTVNFGAGPVTFEVGDWVLYGSGTWQKSNGQNGTVTSVSVTESGDALTITGSPITTAGTINIGFAGDNTQYINGAGGLTTFPSLAGYVTSVTATSPLLSSGGTTPNLSIPESNSATDGYLSSDDWTTFNNKVSTGREISTTAPLQGGGNLSADRTLSITQSNTTTDGYLSATDWNTFNNKQAAITLTTTGTTGAATLIGATLNIPNYSTDLSGYVPYTGATANVNLGTFDLTADVITGATGSFASSGGSDTFAINHSSGSGIALNITKGGNGEGLYINKTSGSGNAATIIGTLNATTLVKSGGTSSQYLMADGSVSTLTNPVTGTGTTNNLPKFTGASTIGNANITDNGTVITANASGTYTMGLRVYNDISTYNSVSFTDASYVAQGRIVGSSNSLGFDVNGFALRALNIASNGTSTFSNSVNLSAIFTNGGAAGNYNAIELRGGTSGTAPNWQISKDNFTANSLQITASTLNGGTTYTTPLFTLLNTGVATFTNSILTNENVQITSDTTATLRLRGGGYGVNYNTSLRSSPSAIGVLQLGNNAGNYILAGNTAVGGFLAIRVNVSSESITSGTEAIRFVSNGNTLIGTDTDAGYKLDVNGTGRFTGALSGTSATFSGNLVVNTGTGATFRAIYDSDNITEIGNFSSASGYRQLNIVASTINLSTGTAGGSSATNSLTIASTGAATFSSSVTTSGNVTISPSAGGYYVYGSIPVARYSYFGYSSGYNGVLLGNTAGQTLFFNVDVTGNPSGSFSGNGSEYVWRNVGSFITPNSSNNGYNTLLGWNSSGQVTLPNTTFIGSSVTGGGALQVNGNVNINGVFQINGVTIGGGGGSGVTGSGTTNYMTKWTGSSTLGNSVIYDTGSNVVIGGTSANRKLEVITGSGVDNGIRLTYANGVTGEGMDITYNNTGATTTRFDSIYVSDDALMQFRMKTNGTPTTPLALYGNGRAVVGSTTRISVGTLSVFSGGAAGVPWGSGLNIGDASNYMGFIQDGGQSTFRNFGVGGFGFYNSAASSIIFFKENGNILINRSTDAGYKFDVNGTGRFTGQLTGTDGLFAGSVTATSGFFDTSDSRLKIVINDYDKAKGIEKVEARLYLKNNKKELGYFAQDVQEILPSAVIEGEDGFLTLSYSQVHTAKIAYLEKEIAELKELIKSLL